MADNAAANKAAKDSDALSGLAERLRNKYQRPALQGRLDQIEAGLTGLAHLIDQLEDEDAREADHEERLIEGFSSGDPAKTPVPGSDAHLKLVAALAARKGN